MKKKIAIIRGPNLNKWEMQNYEPLSGEFDITGYTTFRHLYDINSIKFPVKKLHSISEFFQGIIPKYRTIVNWIMGGESLYVGT